MIFLLCSFAVGKYAAKMMPLFKIAVKNKNVQAIVRIIEIGENWTFLLQLPWTFDSARRNSMSGRRVKMARGKKKYDWISSRISPFFKCYLCCTHFTVIPSASLQQDSPINLCASHARELCTIACATHIKMSTKYVQFTMCARNHKAMQFSRKRHFSRLFSNCLFCRFL